jgi:ankyrin repeat protein
MNPQSGVVVGEPPLVAAAKAHNAQLVASLLEQGCDVNGAFRGFTALHAAATFGDTAIVNLLLSHPGINANPERKTV